MRYLTALLAAFALVVACDAPAPTAEPGNFLVEAPSFASAKALRDVHAPGESIKAICTEESCIWAFMAPAPIEAPVLFEEGCEYLPPLDDGPGVTVCDSYQETKDERDAMIDDGDYKVSDICYHEEEGWHFRWCYEGEEENSCRTNGEGCG
jgi:hypothetical protein